MPSNLSIFGNPDEQTLKQIKEVGEYVRPKLTNRELAALLNITLSGTELCVSLSVPVKVTRDGLNGKRAFFQKKIAQLDRAADLLSIFRPNE